MSARLGTIRGCQTPLLTEEKLQTKGQAWRGKEKVREGKILEKGAQGQLDIQRNNLPHWVSFINLAMSKTGGGVGGGGGGGTPRKGGG